jgi:hypothetical protein
MAKHNLFEEIQEILDQRENKTDGLVSNLHGVAEALPREDEERQATQQWYVFTIPAETHASLSELMDTFSYEQSGQEELTVVGGTVSYMQTEHGVATVLHTTIRLTAPRTVPFDVDAEGAEIALYLSAGRIAKGWNRVQKTEYLSAGIHHVSIVVFGPPGLITVKIPGDIETLRSSLIPSAPNWLTPPEVYYLNVVTGEMLIRLQWGNDSRAAGWQLYRSTLLKSGTIEEATESPGQVVLEYVTYEYDENMVPQEGATVYCASEDPDIGDFIAGRVREVSVVEVPVPPPPPTEDDPDPEDPDPEVHVTLTLDLSATVPDPEDEETDIWLGCVIGLNAHGFDSVARLRYAGSSAIRYDDTNLQPEAFYAYRVTAFGVLSETHESDFSATVPVMSTDREPPGPIIDINYSLIDDRVVIGYKAPDDPDFEGVRVYGPYEIDEEFDPEEDELEPFEEEMLRHVAYGEPDKNQQLTFQIGPKGYYFLPAFDKVGNERKPNLEEAIEITDVLPGVKDLKATVSPNQRRITITGEPDPLAVSWEVWARKTQWPTMDGSMDGNADPTYSRLKDNITVRLVELGASEGSWYFIAHAYTRSGEAGPRATATALVGEPEGEPDDPITEIRNLSIVRNAIGGYHALSWASTGDVAENPTNYKVRIRRQSSYDFFDTELVSLADNHPPSLGYIDYDVDPADWGITMRATYYYTVDLYTVGGVLLFTLPGSIRGDYVDTRKDPWGGGGETPL